MRSRHGTEDHRCGDRSLPHPLTSTPLRLNETYDFLIEISRGERLPSKPAVFLAAISGLPSLDTDAELAVTVYAESVRIKPSWRQQITMSPNVQRTSTEFILIPQRPGTVELRVEFYYGNRWLQKLRKELVIVS